MFSSDTHIDLYRLEGAAQDASLTKTQLLAAMAVSTGSMIVGYSSAWSSPAIASLMEPGSHIEVSKPSLKVYRKSVCRPYNAEKGDIAKLLH